MKKSEEPRVLIDKEKLRERIKEKEYSQEAMSKELGYSKSYISGFLAGTGDTLSQKDEKLISLLLGYPPGYFVLKERRNDQEKEEQIPSILNNLMNEITECRSGIENAIGQVADIGRSVKMILQKMDASEENQDKIFRKLNANTIQLEKIKESVEKMQKTEYDRAKEFLRDILRDGWMNGYDLLDAADKSGISRAKVMQARKELGVEIEVTGYGKNQKSWWYIPKQHRGEKNE